jgi:hypothetical protein
MPYSTLSDIRVMKHTDAEVFNRCKQLREKFGFKLNRMQVSYVLREGDPETAAANIDADQTFQEVLKQNSRYTKYMLFHFDNGGSVRVTRHNDTHFDIMQLTFAPNLELPVYFGFTNMARDLFGETEIIKTLPQLVSKEAKDDIDARRAGLVQLEEIGRGFFDELKKQTGLQYETLNKHRIEYDDNLKAKTEELVKEYKAKQDDLDTATAELEKRRKAVDDRDYKHARRQGLKDQQARFTTLATKFNLTASTSRKRFPVAVLYLLLAAFFGAGAGLFAYKAFTSGQADYLTYVKQAAFTLAFAATMGFFIRWNDVWFREHASEEFRLKRLEIDIDRASWIYEMALEWHEQNKTEIPQYLMEKLSANLFSESEARKDSDKDADTLTSAIVRGAKNISLKMGENQVSVEQSEAGKKAKKP